MMTFSAVHWGLSQSLTQEAGRGLQLCRTDKKRMRIRSKISSMKVKSSTRSIPHTTMNMMTRFLRISAKRSGTLISLWSWNRRKNRAVHLPKGTVSRLLLARWSWTVSRQFSRHRAMNKTKGRLSRLQERRFRNCPSLPSEYPSNNNKKLILIHFSFSLFVSHSIKQCNHKW